MNINQEQHNKIFSASEKFYGTYEPKISLEGFKYTIYKSSDPRGPGLAGILESGKVIGFYASIGTNDKFRNLSCDDQRDITTIVFKLKELNLITGEYLNDLPDSNLLLKLDCEDDILNPIQDGLDLTRPPVLFI